jgi:hypothetical protein
MEQEYTAIQDDLLSQVTSQVLTGSVGKPAELDQVNFNKLSYENKQKVLKLQNDITSGKNTVTNPETFNSLWDDPNLANLNLNNFLGEININDLKELEKRKQDVSGKDLNEIRWNDNAISKIITDNTGLKSENLKFVELRNIISNDIRQAQEKSGKKLSSDEVSGIAKLATAKVVFESTNFFGKPVLKSKNVKDFEGEAETLSLNPEELQNATTLFQANFGKNPTPQELKEFVISYKKGRAQ